MSQDIKNPEESGQYQNDHRLIQAYQEATNLDEEGLEDHCPSYIELSETSNRYQDETLLGKGGVKEVFRTFENHTRRWVAITRLRNDRGPEFYDLFVNEAWLTSSLNHPNILSVHDVGIDSNGHPFFTMDLLDNMTLVGEIKGSPGYMAPEQIDSQRHLTENLRTWIRSSGDFEIIETP